MIIGVPREIKPCEFRAALTPEGVQELISSGHRVLVEMGAGVGSGFSDQQYRKMGAKILSGAKDLFGRADLILKVKEPLPREFSWFRSGQLLFTFLHLAANRQVMNALLKKKVMAIAYETVQRQDGGLPILAPMSQIAGYMAALFAANHLRKDLGGKGIVLSGVGGQRCGRALVLGLGHVGRQAARTLHGMGAELVLYDLNPERSRSLAEGLGERCTIVDQESRMGAVVSGADVVVGAVLQAGKRAPRLVTRSMVKQMEPGSVIVDVAIDQGGCVEGMHPTTLKDPVYRSQGVLHCGVTNLPSLAARSATLALVEQTLPYVKRLADLGPEQAMATDPALAKGLNLRAGEIVHPALNDSTHESA